jgi:hypothetical protein
MKWYIKMFCRLINSAVLHAMIVLYRYNIDNQRDPRFFRVQLVEWLPGSSDTTAWNILRLKTEEKPF